MGESIAIIIIVVILLVVGITFWRKITAGDIQQIDSEQSDRSVIELAKVAAELPELKCYTNDVNAKVNCFDWYKLKAMQNMSKNSTVFDYYFNIFGKSRIIFMQVYPDEMNITVYDYNVSANRALTISIPIIIEKNIGREGKKGFGMMVVEGYY
jgi:hypothetical protein